MKRETGSFATSVFLLVTLPLMFGQDPQTQANPVRPNEILGPQLIAWSQLQKPRPVPQPLPAPDQAGQQQDQHTESRAAMQDPATATTFTGTILKSGSRYVLKVSSNNTYQLDDQELATKYEGKQVRIIGTLNADGKGIHITEIELVS